MSKQVTKQPEAADVKEDKKSVQKRGKYIFAVGRRKSATARIKMYTSGSGAVQVNDREFKDYFPTTELQRKVLEPLVLLGSEKNVDLVINTSGGGIKGQSEAIRLGIARALVEQNQDNKTTLKKEGLMTRDAREKERKKPGLKRARRAPQWQKR